MNTLVRRTLTALVALVAVTGLVLASSSAAEAKDTQWGGKHAAHHFAKDTQWGG